MLLKLLFVLLFAINVIRCDDNNGMVAATENVEEYQNKENYYDDVSSPKILVIINM